MGKTWGFYGRDQELAEIKKIISKCRWFFCALSGRRRIGKTSLIQQALRANPGKKHFYFQTPDSDERGVVQAFQEAIEDCGFSCGIMQSKIFRTFQDMAMFISVVNQEGLIVIIDEFQYFHRKALSPFASYLQAKVDKLRDTDRGGLFVLGSIHTEMTAMLEDRASPLFNRITHKIHVPHWDFASLFEMFSAHDIMDEYHRLFLWTLFEGVPKFYRDCFEQGLLTKDVEYRQNTLRRLFFEGSSPLRDEATNWFLRELRGRYDSVLKILAAKGPCPYSVLKAEYERAGSGGEKQLGGYLATLMDKYQMVEKMQPVFAGNSARKARYLITDNFLSAWLLAMARNVQSARVQPLTGPVNRADAILMVHEGKTFEKMVRLLTEECSRKGVGDFALTEMVHGYWNKADKDKSDIEIDLVARNDDDKIIRFAACKRSASAHDGAELKKFDTHIDKFLKTKDGRRFSGWTVQKALYSPKFTAKQRQSLIQRNYRCLDLADFKSFLLP